MAGTNGGTWANSVVRNRPEPRIACDDHMGVFAASGFRPRLFPPPKQEDGFDAIDIPIYIATPPELDPARHEELKATLAQKLSEARAQPFSRDQLKNIHIDFLRDVIDKAILTAPLPIIRHFAQENTHIAEFYATPEAMKKIRSEQKSGTFESYGLLQHLTPNKQAIEANYRTIKAIFERAGKQEEFTTIETRMARYEVQQLLHDINIPKKEKQHIAEECVSLKETPQGKSIRLNVKPLEALRRRMIDEQYGDLDATITAARQQFATRHAALPDPFAYTAEERKHIAAVEAVAHKEGPFSAVVKAGYHNPNLLLILNKEYNPIYAGISYGANAIAEVGLQSRIFSFELTLTEELMHQALQNIYGNNSLPYRDNDDPRKQAVATLLAEDFNNPQYNVYLGFTSATQYDTENETTRAQELPVKLMAMRQTGELQPILDMVGQQALFADAERYARDVIVKDAIAYNMGKPLGEFTPARRPSGLHGR